MYEMKPFDTDQVNVARFLPKKFKDYAIAREKF